MFGEECEMSLGMLTLFPEKKQLLKNYKTRKSGFKNIEIFINLTLSNESKGINAIVSFFTKKEGLIREIHYCYNSASRHEAGLKASLESLRLAVRCRAKNVVLYLDNEHVALIANGIEVPPPDLISLTLQVRALCHSFESVIIKFKAKNTTYFKKTK